MLGTAPRDFDTLVDLVCGHKACFDFCTRRAAFTQRMPKAKAKSKRRDESSQSETTSSEDMASTSAAGSYSRDSSSEEEQPPAKRPKKAKAKKSKNKDGRRRSRVSPTTSESSASSDSDSDFDLHALTPAGQARHDGQGTSSDEPSGFEAALDGMARDLEGPVETGRRPKLFAFYTHSDNKADALAYPLGLCAGALFVLWQLVARLTM